MLKWTNSFLGNIFVLMMIPDLLSPVVENKAWLLCQSSMPGAREKVFRSATINFIAIATREDVTNSLNNYYNKGRFHVASE